VNKDYRYTVTRNTAIFLQQRFDVRVTVSGCI